MATALLHDLALRSTNMPRLAQRAAARTNDNKVLIGLLGRTDLDHSVRDELGKNNTARVRIAWLRREDLDTDARLEALTSETRATVLAAIAAASGLPDDVYDTLAKNPAPKVASAILGNKDCAARHRAAAAATLALGEISWRDQPEVNDIYRHAPAEHAATILANLVTSGNPNAGGYGAARPEALGHAGEAVQNAWVSFVTTAPAATTQTWDPTPAIGHLAKAIRGIGSPEARARVIDFVAEIDHQTKTRPRGNSPGAIPTHVMSRITKGVLELEQALGQDPLPVLGTANIERDALNSGDKDMADAALRHDPAVATGLQLREFASTGMFLVWLGGRIRAQDPEAIDLLRNEPELVSHHQISTTIKDNPRALTIVIDALLERSAANPNMSNPQSQFLLGQAQTPDIVLACNLTSARHNPQALSVIGEQLAQVCGDDPEVWALADKLADKYTGTVRGFIDTVRAVTDI